MINFFKKYWIFILLALVATLLGFLWLNKKPQIPETPKVSEKIEGFELVGQPISSSTTVKPNVTSTYKSSVPLLKVERQESLSLEKAMQIATLFGFATTPQTFTDAITGEVWLWAEQEHNLTITPGVNDVGYNRDLFNYPSPLLGTFKETAALLGDYSTLFSALGLSAANLKHEERLINEEGKTVRTDERPTFKEVRLKYFYGDNQVLQYTGQDYVVYVWFDSLGRIVKLNSVNTIKNVSAVKSFNIKSFEDIALEIKEKGRIRTVSDGHGVLETEDFITIELTSLDVAYFLPQTGQYAHPVFLFSGTVVDTTGVTRPISVLLQAAKEEEYKKAN